MKELETISSKLDAGRLEDLVVEAVRQYSPSLAEEPATEVFEEALHAAGVPSWRQPVEEEESERDRANLIVQMGPEPPALLLAGHVDTIALRHDEEHKVRTEGDLLYGLGAADMKAGCAAMVEAVAAVAASRVVLKRGLRVALVVGEEEVGDGSEAVAATLGAPVTVIGEPTSLAPCIHHYGYVEYRLATRGRRAHAALPEVGDNAIHVMLTWITDILRRARPQAAKDGPPDPKDEPGMQRQAGGVRGGAGGIGEAQAGFAGRASDGPPDPKDEMAVSLREIRGGTGIFATADMCEALLDVHLPPGRDAGVVAEFIEEARRALPPADAAHVGFDELFWAPGYATDPQDPRLLPLRRAFGLVGRPFRPATFRSHSDAPTLHAAGSLPVVCGPGRLEVAHTRLEHVSMREVHEAALLYAAMIHAFCVA